MMYNLNMINILVFIVALSFIVLIHELGHLISAKIFGVFCFEFSIGFGPKIFSFKYKDTYYSLRLIPLGGYVSMAGEVDEDNNEFKDREIPYENTLAGISKIKKIVILLAGVFMNFLLSYIIFSLILLHNGKHALPQQPIITKVVENYPADIAGIKSGDLIKKITFNDGTVLNNIKNYDDILIFAGVKEGETIFNILRNNEELTFKITPIKENERNIYGFSFKEKEVIPITITNTWIYGFDYMFRFLKNMFTTVVNLFKGIGLSDVSGPIGIVQASSSVIKNGFKSYMFFVALISLNIGLMNLLPIPAVDGGRVLLTLIEIIINKKLNKKFEYYAIGISMLLLIILTIIVTFNDIIKLFIK